jgi:hypothetical protein
MYEIELYINSPKLLQKLVYLKTKLTRDNTIDIQNIVNVKKLNTTTSNNDSDNENVDPLLKPYYTPENEHDNTLLFESRFESGNLLCAFKIDDSSYQLYLQNDTNTTGYIQWFFFRVTNIKKGKKVNINIINMLRKTSLYSHGLQVMCYSVKKAQKENIGWHRAGMNVMYYANNLYFYTRERRRNLYSLVFDYEFNYDDDEVYFANCIPYLYSDVMKELNHYQLNEAKYPFFHRKTLCTTLGGNDLDMFSINTQCLSTTSNTHNSNIQYYPENDKRKGIVLIARQHPGETVSSFVMKGAVEFLMGNSEESKKLRQLYMIRVVPMMNPDGVLVGNSRTSFAGCDLNRRWETPHETIHPEIYHTKEMILKMFSQRDIAFICDFHGHIGAFNSFFYCNHKENRRQCSLFPFICSKVSKIISYNQSNFKMPRYKKGTGRMNLFYELNLNNIVTLETSFFGTNRRGENVRCYFNRETLKEIGRDICLGMLSYYYKYVNRSIDKQLTSLKQLDIDMDEFEQEMKAKENVNDDDNDNDDTNIENSESEPSIDNFDKERLLNLMPSKNKKRKKKTRTTLKKLYKVNSSKKIYKNEAQLNELNKPEIKLFKPNQNAKSQQQQQDNKLLTKSKSMAKISIKCKEINDNIQSPPLSKEDINCSNKKDAETQTEEIFFKMHWSYFAGDYPILQAKVVAIQKNRIGSSRGFQGYNNNNVFYSGASSNNGRQRSVGRMGDGNSNSIVNSYFSNMNMKIANKNGFPTISKSNLFSNPTTNIFANNNKMLLQTNQFIKKNFGYM